jgi:outer membrane protein assembly factor BamA
VRFVISERGQVRVKDIVVHGARRTNESLILSRVAFDEGDVYRRSNVRSTEERLATLGVFSSVTVGLEDPEVFATEKVVVITVRERPPQYLDVRPGFSTGDGFRVTLEYGHRNLAEQSTKRFKPDSTHSRSPSGSSGVTASPWSSRRWASGLSSRSGWTSSTCATIRATTASRRMPRSPP